MLKQFKPQPLILSLFLSMLPIPLSAMEVEEEKRIKETMAAVKEHHEQKHQDQQFGYVKFDLRLEGEKESLTPWIILPNQWIRAFNGHLHARYPDITSEVWMESPSSSSSSPALSLPEQFFNGPKVVSFTDANNLCIQLTQLSNDIHRFSDIKPVIVISRDQENKFIAWVKANHPELLKAEARKNKKAQHQNKAPSINKGKEPTSDLNEAATSRLLWKVLGGTRKVARVSTKIALGSVSGTIGGAAGLVVGTALASAGGLSYSFTRQMQGGYFGGTPSDHPILDFAIGTVASPFVGAGLGGYGGIRCTNKVIDAVDQALYGKPQPSNQKS
ncbi:hypothetical protein [Candidatus Odyssella thessalonicensis]|uniref:hypothetical protein n=1 Tax=Candidatus Odyssella thessalonicensis TaxID=84647 RepID=UPI000225C082|nr:hypothetical protein [Candidatus Odyssella thessalonicensis]